MTRSTHQVSLVCTHTSSSSEELPIRLAHRAKELDELPHDLSDMPSINKVKNWYCQSFEVRSDSPLPRRLAIAHVSHLKELINFPKFKTSDELKKVLFCNSNNGGQLLPESTPNPSLYRPAILTPTEHVRHHHHHDQLKLRVPIEKRSVITFIIVSYPLTHSLSSIYSRYYAETPSIQWPPELHDYNARFTKTLEKIKRRHDPTVTTVAQGVLEWKKTHNTKHIGLDIQAWLDRFYMSRIGIRFLIGQRELIRGGI